MDNKPPVPVEAAGANGIGEADSMQRLGRRTTDKSGAPDSTSDAARSGVGGEGDWRDSEEYQAFLESCAKDCRCTHSICDGVLAGGLCDEIIEDDSEEDDYQRGCARCCPIWLRSDTAWQAHVAKERGAYSQRRKWALRTGASGCSSWPTPKTATGDYSCQPGTEREKIALNLQGAAKQWTTPQAHDSTQRGAGQQPCRKAGNACLARDAAQWRTPTDDSRRGGAQDGAKRVARGHALNLQDQVHLWPTPRGGDGEKGGPNQRDGTGSLHLSSSATQWPTPSVQDSANNAGPSQHGRHTRPLNVEAARFHPAPETSTPGARSSPSSRVLNPRFVEALMGWPLGWTDCDCVEMAWGPRPPRSPGASSTPACAPEPE